MNTKRWTRFCGIQTLNKLEHKTPQQCEIQDLKKKRKKRRIYDSQQILNTIQLLKKGDHRILNKCGIQHSRILNKCGLQHSSKVKTTKQLINTKQWPATRVNHSSPVSVSLILFYLVQGALSFRRSTLRNSSRSEGTWCVPGMLGRCWNSIWVKSAWISPWCLFYTCCIPEQVKKCF